MSRHLQQKFCYISSRHCLDNIFSPILKNSGKKLIFLKNNCFRVSHMGCAARFLSLMIFLSFPQLNFIFRASILNCTAAFFARLRYFKKVVTKKRYNNVTRDFHSQLTKKKRSGGRSTPQKIFEFHGLKSSENFSKANKQETEGRGVKKIVKISQDMTV